MFILQFCHISRLYRTRFVFIGFRKKNPKTHIDCKFTKLCNCMLFNTKNIVFNCFIECKLIIISTRKNILHQLWYIFQILDLSCTSTPLRLEAEYGVKHYKYPEFKDSYDSYLDCVWVLEAPKGEQVEVAIFSMLTESCCDILEVYL